jgi:hypothetical protein
MYSFSRRLAQHFQLKKVVVAGRDRFIWCFNKQQVPVAHFPCCGQRSVTRTQKAFWSLRAGLASEWSGVGPSDPTFRQYCRHAAQTNVNEDNIHHRLFESAINTPQTLSKHRESQKSTCSLTL